MRDSFIGILDKLISLFVVLLLLLGVVVAANTTGMSGGSPGPNGVPLGGDSPIAGVFVLIGGLLYVSFMASFMYLGLGIYHNTRHTAEALENKS